MYKHIVFLDVVVAFAFVFICIFSDVMHMQCAMYAWTCNEH